MANRLKTEMDRRGLTCADVARMAGLGRSTIEKATSGQRVPTEKVACQIETALGLEYGTIERKPYISIKYDMHREETVLKAWNRGARTPSEVAKITGYSMRTIGRYLPLGIEGEKRK